MAEKLMLYAMIRGGFASYRELLQSVRAARKVMKHEADKCGWSAVKWTFIREPDGYIGILAKPNG